MAAAISRIGHVVCCFRRAVLVVTALLSVSPCVADDWPQWLGPRRDGIWRETGILRQFPKDGLRVKWRVDIAGGYAGPAVAEGRVYVTDFLVADKSAVPDDPFQRGRIPGRERVLCLDEVSGRVLWKHEYECPYSISYPAGPRATPAIDDGRVYTLGSEGNLFCLEAETGKVVWSSDFKKDYNLEVPVWGTSAHPLVDGRKLISMVGGKGTTVVAFDKNTGKEMWRALSAREPGYCPPVIYEAGGKRQLIVWDAAAVHSLDPETGREYWKQPLAPAFGMSIAMPRKHGDLLFLTSYQDNAAMLRLDSQSPAASLVWTADRQIGFRSTMSTPFIDEEGYIYGNDSNGEFRCVEAATGKRLWGTFAPTTAGRPVKWATAFLVKNGDRYFLPNELGDLIIADLSPEGYKEISRTRLLEPTGNAGGRNVLWSHPAFANRTIYARNDREIIAASLAADDAGE